MIIAFDSWFTKHLAHVPLQPVSGLAIWGLSDSDSSYPYCGYIQVELALPKKMASCLRHCLSHCSDNIPILVGTNVH